MKPSQLTMADFAELVYKLRNRPGKFVSQTKLAEIAGYTQTYVSLIEAGRVNPSKRCKNDLLRALGIDSPSFFTHQNKHS